jgi:DNA-binding transcriptional LysR family regulator
MDYRSMEFRQIEVFRVLAEELHFGRAARRLYMAQPSVSQQLQKLEEELGVRLLHRSSRDVRLTPAGSAFLTETVHVIDAVEDAKRAAREAAAGHRGALRIAANYPASRLLLLPLLEALRARSPGITTIPRELGSPEQLRALNRGELDLGLVYGPIDDPGIATEHLIDVPVVGIVRPEHHLSARDRVDFATVRRFPYVTSYAGGSRVIEDALVECAAAHGIRLRRSPSATDLSGYLLELETTDAIGFSSLPRGEQNRANGMHILRLVPPEPVLQIHAAWNAAAREPLVNTALGEMKRLASVHRGGG